MSASTTQHYQLYVTDDANELFLDWRNGMGATANSNMTKIDAALYGKADKSTSVVLTLDKDAWTGDGPFTQVLAVSGLGADQNGEVCVASTADASQREQARSALLSVAGQAAGQLTIVADGDKPAIDIPVAIVFIY